MFILLWIVFGALVGWVASILMGRNNKMGLVANIIVGLVGSALGSWIAQLLGLGSLQKFTIAGFGFAILGAVVLLGILNIVLGKNR